MRRLIIRAGLRYAAALAFAALLAACFWPLPAGAQSVGGGCASGAAAGPNALGQTLICNAGAWQLAPAYPGADSAACTGANTGEVVYSGGAVKFCNGSAWTLLAPAIAASAPQGRLTLISGTPVMSADATAKSTIYYDCHVGQSVPVYNGTSAVPLPIAACEIALALTAAAEPAGNLYDVFAVAQSGALTLCAGPAWSTKSARSSAVHNSVTGFWSNAAALSHCYNGATDYGPVVADQATLLGSFYTTGAGQTSVQLSLEIASGGANPIIGIGNAYNLVESSVGTQDSEANWGDSSTSWRQMAGSASNQVRFVDSLGQIAAHAVYIQNISAGLGTLEIGIDENSSSATPAAPVISGSGTPGELNAMESFPPAAGLNTLVPMELGALLTTQLFSGGTMNSFFLRAQY